jgi:trans-L-3-hydroxyproline dehydratase
VSSTIKTVDAHVGGQPVRVIVDGWPGPGGKTMAARCDWLRRKADQLRRASLLPPRGHQELRGVLMTEPIDPGSHAGVVTMDADGYPPMSGHALMALATVAVERQLLFSRQVGRGSRPESGRDAADGNDIRLTFDTAAGAIPVRARVALQGAAARVDGVTVTMPPAWVHTASQLVRVGARELRVDLAFGGLFHAIVDTEAVGVPLHPSRIPELSRLAVALCQSLDAAVRVTHPVHAAVTGIAGVIFTGPPQDPEAHLRNVSVTAGGRVNWSPGGTTTAAVMAVLDAMGMLPEDQPFVHEGLAGTLFRGRAARRTLVADTPALVAEVEGSAWITGEHTLLLDEDDPLKDGLFFSR